MQDFPINPQPTFHIKLGDGGDGTVFLETDIDDGTQYVVKCFSNPKIAEQEVNAYSTLYEQVGERPFLAKVDTQLRRKDGHTFFVMRYYPKGSLLDYINKNSMDNNIHNFFKQMVEIAKFLKDHGIFHCDLKPENFVVGDDDTLVLIDFARARFNDANLTLFGSPGTTAWAAPEALESTHYNAEKSEVGVLGRILFAMRFLKMFTPPFRPTDGDTELNRLLRSLLEKDPGARPTLDQLATDPYVTRLPPSASTSTASLDTTSSATRVDSFEAYVNYGTADPPTGL